MILHVYIVTSISSFILFESWGLFIKIICSVWPFFLFPVLLLFWLRKHVTNPCHYELVPIFFFQMERYKSSPLFENWKQFHYAFMCSFYKFHILYGIAHFNSDDVYRISKAFLECMSKMWNINSYSPKWWLF